MINQFHYWERFWELESLEKARRSCGAPSPAQQSRAEGDTGIVRGEKVSVALEQKIPGFELEALGQGNPQVTPNKVEKMQLILVGRCIPCQKL